MVVLMVQDKFVHKLIKLEGSGVVFDVATEHISNLSIILNSHRT